MSALSRQARAEKPVRVPLTDRELALRQAATIETFWRKAGFPTIEVQVVDQPMAAGRGLWTVKTNLRNGLPPS